MLLMGMMCIDRETAARAEFREPDVHAQIRQAAQPTSS
jgi:hypothetical protein